VITKETDIVSLTVSPQQATTWNTPRYGDVTFQTTASGGYLPNTQTFTIDQTKTDIELCVNYGRVQLDVRNVMNNISIEVNATITYSGVASGTLRWTGVSSFTHGGFGSYTFRVSPDSRYGISTVEIQIGDQTPVVIYVYPSPIPVTAVQCQTLTPLPTVATLQISNSASYTSTLTIPIGGQVLWAFPSYSSFVFSGSAPGFLPKTQTIDISSLSTQVQICFHSRTVQVDIQDLATRRSIWVGATITFNGVITGSFRWNGVTTFEHGGYGAYNFIAAPDSRYQNGAVSTTIDAATTLIIIYVTETNIPMEK